jgi:hypothetical protein
LIPENWLSLRLIKVGCQCRHEENIIRAFISAKMVLPEARAEGLH